MIPVEFTFLIFFSLMIITSSRTYFFLALLYLINMWIYPYTSEDDLTLLDKYASIDLAAGIAILVFGDIHKIYQSIILAMILFSHFVFENVLQYDFYYDASSTIYENVIAALLIAQMMGVFRGTNYLHNPIFDTWKVYCSGSWNTNSNS